MQGNLSLKVNVLNKIEGYVIVIVDSFGGLPGDTVLNLEGLKVE